MAELTAKNTQKAYKRTVNDVIAPASFAPTPNTLVPSIKPPRIAVGTDSEPHHQNAAYLSGGVCRSGRSTSCGVQLCT